MRLFFVTKNHQIKIDHQNFYSPLLMPFSSNATLNTNNSQMLIFELKRDDD